MAGKWTGILVEYRSQIDMKHERQMTMRETSPGYGFKYKYGYVLNLMIVFNQYVHVCFILYDCKIPVHLYVIIQICL